MKTTKFTGKFRNEYGREYELTVNCFSFFQAFFLLTADAIRNGSHYQLATITSEDGEVKHVGDIMQCSEIIK